MPGADAPQAHDARAQSPDASSPTPNYVRRMEMNKKMKTALEMQGEICSYGSRVEASLAAPSSLTGQQVVKFQAGVDFTCKCKICELQMTSPDGRCVTPRQKNWALYTSPKDSSAYCKLIEQLISPTNEIESCTCLITDTVFISEDGKP